MYYGEIRSYTESVTIDLGVLTSLRNESVACCNVDTGIRDNTTNQVDYDLWNKKVQQSQMEISIINLLIDYINGKDIYIYINKLI